MLPSHYLYTQQAAQLLGLSLRDLDHGRGYLYSVTNGSKTIVLSAGRGSPYPLNSAAAVAVAKDKIFTNSVLEADGISTLGGRCFFLTSDHRKLRGDGYEIADAWNYLQEVGYPCFCKPLLGAGGDFAERVFDPQHFDRYIDRVRSKHDAIVIQRVFEGEEYRVFVLDDVAIYCIRKADFALVGDGNSTLEELLNRHNAALRGTGVSEVDTCKVVLASGEHITLDRVVAQGERLVVNARRNLSAQGSPGTLVDPCPVDIAECARHAARSIGLRVSGIDLLRDKSDGTLRVVEVNGNPGIQSLELLGRKDLVTTIWTEVLKKAFAA